MGKFIKIILVILAVLFIYGLGSGIYDANFNSKSSLLSMGIKAAGMNPISVVGYRIGIHTNPEIQNRINEMNSDVNFNYE